MLWSCVKKRDIKSDSSEDALVSSVTVVVASSWHMPVASLVAASSISLSPEICRDEQKFRNASSRYVHADKVRDAERGT